MQYTEHNKLNLPELVDQYNLKHWNENTTKIDEKLNEHQVKLDASTPETTPSSLMMRNEQGKVKVTTPLEQDDTNMAVNIDYLINVFRTKMLDEAHPKGEIYYTEDKNFDPNISWVGTWVRIKDKFIYALGDNGNAGDTGGSSTHTLSVSEMPSHSHSFSGSVSGDTGYSGSHHHERGTMNITGEVRNNSSIGLISGSSGTYTEGAFYKKSYTSYGIYQSQESSYSLGFDASNGWTGHTSDNGSHYHSFSGSISGTTGSKGGGNSFSILPPYEKAYCWKRTE